MDFREVLGYEQFEATAFLLSCYMQAKLESPKWSILEELECLITNFIEGCQTD